MWDWNNIWSWWGGMAMMMLWMVAFWGGIIALAIWVVNKLTGREAPRPGGLERRDPLEMAKERYAKGEISREEFEQIKKDLS
ncbi:MAG: hypothetical protein A2Y60_04605 [Chloroflexi bacterium RBG_13_54_9]|nr:MAG: hypothetical protein A2Y60_04605 [Chloroflexi bacterium RBG_13_54_9]